MQDSVILITTAVEPGARSAKRAASALYGDALARAGPDRRPLCRRGPRDAGRALRRPAVIWGRRSGPFPLRAKPRIPPPVPSTPGATPKSLPCCAPSAPAASRYSAFAAASRPSTSFLAAHCSRKLPAMTASPIQSRQWPAPGSPAWPAAFFKANSYHHQAVGRLAPGLRAAAYADDGQIEALEHESLPIPRRAVASRAHGRWPVRRYACRPHRALYLSYPKEAQNMKDYRIVNLELTRPRRPRHPRTGHTRAAPGPRAPDPGAQVHPWVWLHRPGRQTAPGRAAGPCPRASGRADCLLYPRRTAVHF